MTTHRLYHPRRAALALALALGASAAAGAETEADQEAERSRQWYAVELIVFEQSGIEGSAAERWPGRAGDPSYPLWQIPAGCAAAGSERPVAAGAAAGDGPAGAQGSEAAASPLHCLPAARRQLDKHWAILRRSGAYQPRYHIGWLQPGLSEARSVAVPVPLYWRPASAAEAALPGASSGPALRPPVYGLVRVFRERYLHAAVDLRLQRRHAEPDADLEALLRAPRHVMRQRRRLRSGELHYLDHPYLGVLLSVRALEAPPAAARDAGG
ncbi:CsiV family protein [Halorhodospira neutriphila]|uniref:Peptidoglycan-binding protein, CsiV n=1 Tax=Halorhodospira neutriphila TaxID=168379 RepID=A0ABS1E6J0_9GAMM|nr:CsiV family protein [Halorhodospira neutriphila]MBK1726762.1 hypothetical protein [Halorhodospira neutriphila]